MRQNSLDFSRFYRSLMVFLRAQKRAQMAERESAHFTKFHENSSNFLLVSWPIPNSVPNLGNG